MKTFGFLLLVTSVLGQQVYYPTYGTGATYHTHGENVTYPAYVGDATYYETYEEVPVVVPKPPAPKAPVPVATVGTSRISRPKISNLSVVWDRGLGMPMVVIMAEGQPGVRYILEVSSDLKKWVVVDELFIDTSGRGVVRTPFLISGRQFFRVRRE